MKMVSTMKDTTQNFFKQREVNNGVIGPETIDNTQSNVVSPLPKKPCNGY